VSTSRVYAFPEAANPRIAEDYPLGPTRGYGRSKLLAETLIEEAVARHGLDAVIVRAFQHTGPRQDDRLMLPEWARQLMAGSPNLEVKHLDAAIDCSDVRDVVRAYRLLAIAGNRGAAYNVGSGISRRSGEVVNHLCRLAGRRPRIVERSPGFKQDPIADIGRLVAATGWRAEIPWEQTLRDTLDDWRQRLAQSVATDTSLEPSA
jgi:GDP-4-dehydro-6-deoxy-D-mannose reductase